MIFSAIISNGFPLFDVSDRKSLNEFYKSREGKTIWISISDKKPARSLLQNNYLWAVVYHYISEDTKQAPEEIHAEMKSKFLPRVFKKEGDKEIELEKSTTRLTTKEFTDYIEQVRAFAADLGISIPDPE